MYKGRDSNTHNTQNPLMIRNLVFLLASVCFTKLQSQDRFLDSLKLELENHDVDTVAVHLNSRIAETYLYRNRPDDALPYINQSRSLSEKLEFKKGEYLSAVNMGMYSYFKSDYQAGLANFRVALEFLISNGEARFLGKVYNWMGNCHLAQSNYFQALQYHLKALSNRELFQDNVGIAQSLNNISTIYIEQKDFETALSFQFRSLKLKQEIGDTRGTAFSFNNLGLIYSNLDKLTLAEKYFGDAYDLFKSLNYQRGIALSLGNLGEIYEKRKQFEKSWKTLTEAIDLIKELDDKKALSEAHNHLGFVELNLYNYEQAQQHLMQAREYAVSINADNELIENYLFSSKLDSARRNINAAFNWFKKYTALKEKLFNLEKTNQLSQMQAYYNDEKKNTEIAILKAEKEIENGKRRAQLTISVVVVVALFVLAIILIVLIRQKQKNNLKLQEQKKYSDELNQLKDKLFSIISHDLKSPLNSLKAIIQLFNVNALTEAELKRMMTQLGQSTQNISALIENLLHWAKNNISGNVVHKEIFDLKTLVKENLELLKDQASLKNIQLIDSTEENLKVIADPDMINLVIRNLVSNSIKFCDTGGKIEISNTYQKNQLCLSVKDNGIGIETNRLLKLFGNENSSTKGTQNETGTGLGLILCKDFIEKK